jgi:hypothetical protein
MFLREATKCFLPEAGSNRKPLKAIDVMPHMGFMMSFILKYPVDDDGCGNEPSQSKHLDTLDASFPS